MESVLCVLHRENEAQMKNGVGLIESNEICMFNVSVNISSFTWIGGGNGNPLQCSCLENPRDGEAW